MNKSNPETPPSEEPLSRSDRIALRISVIQTVLAVTGLFMGTVALYAALNEADAVRKQQQAIVWPNLQLERHYSGRPGEESIEFIATNKGIGPALVRSMTVAVDGDPAENWPDVITQVTEVKEISMSNASLGGQAISAGEDLRMLGLYTPFNKLETIKAMRKAHDEGRIILEACYCSVFDDCFVTRSDKGGGAPVPQCPAQPENIDF